MHIIKWKQPTWEGYIPTRRHSRKGRTMETVKRSMVSRERAREKGMGDAARRSFVRHGKATL